jgi:parallel beta-helix repeat protein
MRTLAVILLAAAIFFPLTGYATDVSGYQWGTWTRENSPYNVVGKVTVPPESTLVIEPGVVVNFQGHYKFKVDSSATLLAVGTETDSIYFTTDDTATGWNGIYFRYASDASVLSYCRLEYGKARGSWPGDRGGAIHCHYSSPTIGNNIISSNSAEEYGGGIYCHYSSPVISDNTIIDNWAEIGGGGIYCQHCSPEISNNTISGNQANGERSGVGGGIFCIYDSNPTISGNAISGNFAHFHGGGVVCANSSAPLIIGNSISRNWAGWDGAGIYCEGYCDPLISNNTISGNGAGYYSGGIFCYDSSPTITNTIVWGNTAPNSPQIYLDGHPVVTYCNIQGGWQGEGNIDADPIFVGPVREDFHLRWRSPCIDAGLPDSLDPDGTRSDIGAFYFDQDVDGIVELYPHDTPIVIPPEGGEIAYDGWVFNFFGHPGRIDIWSYAFVPEMGRYGPIDLYENVRIPADSIGKNGITQHVPGTAPAGDYAVVAYVGEYPSTIIDSSYFYFTKTGWVAGELADWQTLNGWFDDFVSNESRLPSHYALSQNYPNPFNARTTINYQLPADSDVKLEICNVLGQKVATLVDSKQQAGYRSAVWDASDISSGIYFYRLTAADYTETRRMMLLK